MKKLVLPLLLILGISMLLAVESDPSEVVGYVKYDLVAGNNMIAIPMASTWTWASEIGDMYAGNVDQVYYWDQASQSFLGAADLGGFWDGDFEVGSGNVLMLNSYAVDSFFSIGDLPATNAVYNVVAGNNTIMVPLNRSDLAWASEIGMEMVAGTVDQVYYWDTLSQSFLGAADLGGFWDGDFEVAIGMPLMVNSYDALTWPAGRQMNVQRNSRVAN